MLLGGSSGFLFAVIFTLYMSGSSVKAEPEITSDILAEHFEEYYESGRGMLSYMPTMERKYIIEYVKQLRKTAMSKYVCLVCEGTAKILLHGISNRRSSSDIEYVLNDACVALGIQPKDVCRGLIALNLETILYIIKITPDLTPSRICGTIFQSFSCSPDEPSLEWTVDIDLGPKPEPSESGSSYKDVSDNIEIIQISDIHYEQDYMINGNAACEEPMCCRSSQGNATDESGMAGYWGDYRKCDLPWHTVQNLLTHVKTTHKNADYIYMTGDIVDHAIWDTSIQYNSEAIVQFMKELKAVFGDTPVFPILGNHEPTPVNVFAPLNIANQSMSTDWLFELIADLWSDWLPPETRDSILKGGFYTVLVKPGFRVIGLNNNVCYTLNWWLLHDPKDPYNQLKWMAETLLEAEKNGEKVHILGHIPAGDSMCLRTWSREYNKLIDRFENTVTAQFNGHTHFDEYQLFYSSSSQNTSIGVAFNGGSATTYEYLNSNYKVYFVHPQTAKIIDYETWTFNLTEANLNQDAPPNWYKLYTCREAYELDELSPKYMDNLVHKMAKNESVLLKYHRYYMKNSDPMLKEGCNDNCQRNHLCQIVTADLTDNTQCVAILNELERP